MSDCKKQEEWGALTLLQKEWDRCVEINTRIIEYQSTFKENFTMARLTIENSKLIKQNKELKDRINKLKNILDGE